MASELTPLARLWSALRSRRLAIWLLLGCAGYGAVVTSIPALGAKGFSSPVFLIASAWLGASTTACAWERSRQASRQLREPEGVSESVAARLERSPVVATAAGSIDDAREATKAALRSAGLRVRATPTVVRGRAGRFGSLGSPVFHWALALLFLVIGLGRMSRSEGLIGVPVGGSLVNESTAYGKLERGALYPNLFGAMSISVPSLTKAKRPDGMALGLVPTVRLLQGDRVLAEGRVYPNHPLRYGPLLVHNSAWGYYGRFSLVKADGSIVKGPLNYFDLNAKTPGGIAPVKLELTSDSGGRLPVLVQPIAVKGTVPGGRTALLTWKDASGRDESATIAVGGSVAIGGARLRFDEAGRYARLSVVDDWSVYVMYALLGIAIAGLSAAILVPRRTAWVLLEQSGNEVELRLLAVHERRDPNFEVIVEDALLAMPGARRAEGDS